MQISKKWFNRVDAEHVRAASERAGLLGDILFPVSQAIGEFQGNLEQLTTTAFITSIDRLKDDAQAVVATHEFEDAGFEALLVIHDLLTLRMHLLTAYECRLAAERLMQRHTEKVLAAPNSWSRLGPLEFSVLASWIAERDEGGLSSRLKAVYKALTPDVSREARPVYRGFALATGDVEAYRVQSTSTISPIADAGFADYLRGKRIAIVGPVNTGARNGEEIEEFDIIIRFNHHDNAKYDQKFFGGRTDVSYYTDPAFKKLVAKPGGKLGDLKYAIPQNASEVSKDADLSELKAVLRSQYRRSNGIFFKSHGNALQRTLFDIMRFDVQEVRAFNMDMWVSSHDRNYKARRATMDPHMFIHHDLIANLLFTKNAVANGVITVDDVLAKVLLMRPKDYVTRLELIHGENFRDQQDAALK